MKLPEVNLKNRVLLSISIAFALFSSFYPFHSMAGPWNQHISHLNSFGDRIHNKEEEISVLIEEKRKAKSPEQLKAILQDIIAKHRELKEIHGDFQKERSHVRFEHPEKGEETDREYRSIKLKSVEEIESEIGVDRKLVEIKKKVEEVYETQFDSEKGDEKSKNSRKPSSEYRKPSYQPLYPTPTPLDRIKLSL